MLKFETNCFTKSKIEAIRVPRTTTVQKELLINYISENKEILLGGKIHPLQLNKFNNLWNNLTKELNKSGKKCKAMERGILF